MQPVTPEEQQTAEQVRREAQREADRRTNRQVFLVLIISGLVIALGVVAMYTGIGELATEVVHDFDRWVSDFGESTRQ